MATTKKSKPKSMTRTQIPTTMRAAAIDRFGSPSLLKIHTLPVPKVGARAPRSRTPTLSDASVAALTTAQPPDRGLLRYSVAASLAAHKPFVVTFATPKYCTSRTCGPVVDVVDAVRRKLASSGVRFIHVEVYTDNNVKKGYNVWMRQWGLSTEPWTFLVGRDGRIKGEFEGSVSVGELTNAVTSKLL